MSLSKLSEWSGRVAKRIAISYLCNYLLCKNYPSLWVDDSFHFGHFFASVIWVMQLVNSPQPSAFTFFFITKLELLRFPFILIKQMSTPANQYIPLNIFLIWINNLNFLEFIAQQENILVLLQVYLSVSCESYYSYEQINDLHRGNHAKLKAWNFSTS